LRVQHEPQATAIAELISAVVGCTVETATSVVENICLNVGLFDQEQAWARFRNSSHYELTTAGLTGAQATRLLAATEFGKRVFLASPGKIRINNPESIYALLKYDLAHATTEKLVVIVLTTKYDVISIKTVSQGSVDECIVTPQQVFKAVISANGASCVIAHNHPSGNPDPSPQDVELTKRMLDAAKVMHLPVLDHIVVGANTFYSFRQEKADLWNK
jgi:DNA repair protein RadC